MKTKIKNKIRQFYLFIFLFMNVFPSHAQLEGYLTNRIKPGDIFYRDEGGQEGFVDYRQWNQADPPGIALGVVFYSYYGTVPPETEGVEAGWHGWIVALDQRDSCAWAPEGSVCNINCVASYEVEGIYTPWNPMDEGVAYALGDTCGWQNTKRILEFIYTGAGETLSEAVSPALYYIFSEKNGVTDFSQKPLMQGDSWYLMGYGQLRVLFGYFGFVNAAMASCGGTLFSLDAWYTSTEVSLDHKKGVWSYDGTGWMPNRENWFKKNPLSVRAVRNF